MVSLIFCSNALSGSNNSNVSNQATFEKMSFFGRERERRHAWSGQQQEGGSIKDSMSILHARRSLVELSRTAFEDLDRCGNEQYFIWVVSSGPWVLRGYFFSSYIVRRWVCNAWHRSLFVSFFICI